MTFLKNSLGINLSLKHDLTRIAEEGHASEKGLYRENCLGRSGFRERVILRALLGKVRLQRKAYTVIIASEGHASET
jgi:hypothetical protein